MIDETSCICIFFAYNAPRSAIIAPLPGIGKESIFSNCLHTHG